MADKRYRVAQWGTGHTGMHSLRTVIEHPDYDLVAARVYTDAKVGRDAGELCGLAPVGVATTTSLNEVLAAGPDCVLYMPLLHHHSIDDMARILASGSNIVTTVTGFVHPPTMDPEIRKTLESACEKGNTSIYGTGSCPGFITEVVPLALLAIQRKLDRLSIRQFADLSTRKSPEFLSEIFGIDPATADLDDGARRSELADGAALRQVADSLNVPIDDMTATSEYAVATEDVEIAVMTIKEGTIGAWRQQVVGYHEGRPLLEYSRTKYVVKQLSPDWQVKDTSWHLSVQGDCPMEVDLAWATQDYGVFSPGINSNVPVNAVAAVCDARPGFLTTAELRIVPNYGS